MTSGPATSTRQGMLHRLDRLGNPSGPSLRVFERLASEEELARPPAALEQELIERLAPLEAIPEAWLTLGGGADELVAGLVSAFAAPDALVLFPPSDPGQERIAGRLGLSPLRVMRSSRMATDLERQGLPGFPPNAVSLVQSPNDPTGTITAPQDIVRMARRSKLVVVDERHAGPDHRSLLPLVREFDNVVIVRSFELWAGLSAFPVAYAIGSPRLMAALSERRVTTLPAACLIAAHATLDDLRFMRAMASRQGEEKARLFRMLRKLNLLAPYPSWASFVLVRFERGDSNTILEELAVRGIRVHRPRQPELAGHARISAVSQDATAALRAALIEIAAAT